MRRAGYQFLGFVVWRFVVTAVRRRYGDAPKKLAAGAVLVAILAALLFALRRNGGDDV